MSHEYTPQEHMRVICSIKPRHSQVGPINSFPLKLGTIGITALNDSKTPLLKGNSCLPLLWVPSGNTSMGGFLGSSSIAFYFSFIYSTAKSPEVLSI